MPFPGTSVSGTSGSGTSVPGASPARVSSTATPSARSSDAASVTGAAGRPARRQPPSAPRERRELQPGDTPRQPREARQRSRILDPHGPLAVGPARIAHAGAARAEGPVHRPAQFQKRGRRLFRRPQYRRERGHRPGAAVRNHRRVPLPEMPFRHAPLQRLGVARCQPPADEQRGPSRELGPQSAQLFVHEARGALDALDPPGRQEGGILDQRLPAGRDQYRPVHRTVRLPAVPVTATVSSPSTTLSSIGVKVKVPVALASVA